MFKFNIHLITNNNNNNSIKAPPLAVVVSTAEEQEQEDGCLGVLSPTKAFFDQDPDNPVRTFTVCQFTPHELVLIPHDAHIPDRSLAPPCLFDLKTNTTTPFPNCLERKWEPIAATVDNRICVLSTSAISNCLEPRFEDCKPNICDWTQLPKFPFSGWGNYVTGHAVLNDQFLLVCINSYDIKEESEFYSFNTRISTWKRVKQQPPPPDDLSESTAIYPNLFGQGVVLFEDGGLATCGAGATCCGVIYSYCSLFAKLLAFSYTNETLYSWDSLEHDITLGPVSLVKGFQVTKITSMNVDGALTDYKSGAITKLDHNILCVLHADTHFSIQPVLDVSGLVIQIHDDDFKSCTILKSFTCAFSRGDLLRDAHIKSCLALQLEDDSTLEKEMDCSSTSTDDEEME